ncbi:MAG TPA: TetR/AcrR family transcriptional regulator [Mucilaginibacter sp.]
MSKQKIAEIALREFLKNGVWDVTIAKLIAPLHISSKTFYKHYESKEALLAECLDILYERHYDEFRKITSGSGNPVNKILAVFKIAFREDFGITNKFYHDINHYYPNVQNAAIEKIGAKSGALIQPLFDQAVEAGFLIPELNKIVCLMAINTLYVSMTRGKDFLELGHDSQLLFQNLVEVYFRGMCTNKGRKLLDTQLKDK